MRVPMDLSAVTESTPLDWAQQTMHSVFCEYPQILPASTQRPGFVLFVSVSVAIPT